ncbi:iron ABC transporter substrate-binding protein [Marinobacter piscensis]|uniref:iron ABC transporter substrate-binding protein n=1 Tax=Marinobacter piscensis TaxID=1562308 RepID=UPI00164305C2|nr:iron ABC transporter substrate-binding protein [Marinobacter piscensis]
MNRRHFLGLMGALTATPLLPARADAAESKQLLHLFGDLPPPSQVQRVLAAGAPAGVLVYTLAPETLLGWPMSMQGEKSRVVPEAYRNLPYLGRLAGRGSTMPLEKLLALKPDVIIDVGTVDDTYLSAAKRVHQQTGIPYLLVDGSLEDSPQQLQDVGQLLGVPDRAAKLATYAEKTLGVIDTMPANRPSVYLARGPKGLETGLPGSINTEVIALAGGRNAVQVESGGNLAQVSLEQLLHWQPDMIVTQSAGFFELAQSAAAWQHLPAIKNRQCYLLPEAPFGWLDGPPSVNRLVGINWLANKLQNPGSRRSDTKLWADKAADFYQLFYGTRPGIDIFAGQTVRL